MSAPRVSILLPTLNSRAFLDERLDSIFAQTFSDWELIVADSFSDDGTWPVLQAAARDPRIILSQTPRDGIYPNWNRCLARARGEFVYVAPADDTMSPEFLAELVGALDAYPDCDLAQCCLHGIDAQGAVLTGWWRLVGAAKFFGDDYLRPHLRRAPYDGVLHAAMHTIYHSITQVLLRRRVFEKAGSFPETFGPGGDFLWGMKVGLTCNVVHVPQFLATWRMHAAQASYGHRATPTERSHMVAMVDAALTARWPNSAAAKLPAAPLRFPYRYEQFRYAYAAAATTNARFRVVARMLAQPSVACRAAGLILSGRHRTFDKVDYTRRLLGHLGLLGNFHRLAGPATAAPV